MDTSRQMMNLRVIRVSFHAAIESHPDQRDAAVESARNLLREVRRQATTQEVLDGIASLEAEVDAAMNGAYRREG